MPKDRVSRFVADPASDSFEALALEVFRFQYGRVEPFRRLCDTMGRTPATVDDWRDVPAVPTLAFQTLDLAAAPPEETFRSSGTTGGPRSVHPQPHPDLYRQIVDASFPAACLVGLERPPMLALVPPRAELPDSSLSFMIDHVVTRFGGEGSTWAFGARGVDVPAARSWVAIRQRDRRPCLVLATSFALAALLEALERRYLHFRLAPGSVVFDTGGFKGRTKEIDRSELLARLETFLGVPSTQVVREYGMTELTSQAYTGELAGDTSGVFRPPHWMRVRVLDPETLAEAPAGTPGLLAVHDLGNVGSVAHVLTEDLGVVEGDGFRLLGRAGDAELRGCSLTVEELAAGRS